ncbi:MAG: citronellol/citronellal dehydrogenase [Myxococcota bacterium]|jgi:citronellol/citronellal dehydrogenase
MSLSGRTLFITGGSRGIGKAIALRAARDGANVCIAAKTATPNPRLPGTVFSAAEEIEAAGGKALPVVLDVRDASSVAAAVEATVARFGGIDILVNNASAIFLAGTLETPLKRFDLMHQVNVRGTFATSQACLPHLLRSDNPHILTLSPPLNLEPKWFGPHLAYSLSKYGMSLCVLGLAEEFAGRVAVNALWPKTTIATAAVRMLGGEALVSASRTPQIMADAAHAVLSRPHAAGSGQFLIDEDVLRDAGVTDLDQYAVQAGASLAPDLFV